MLDILKKKNLLDIIRCLCFLNLENDIFDRLDSKRFLYKIIPYKKEGEVYDNKSVIFGKIIEEIFKFIIVYKIH